MPKVTYFQEYADRYAADAEAAPDYEIADELWQQYLDAVARLDVVLVRVKLEGEPLSEWAKRARASSK